MATDFSYNEKTINSGGPIKPSGINQPLDPRTEVKLYADIKLIPNPYVGMIITVLEDETNSNKMTDYKVLSLKANNLGVANSVVDQVQRYVDYLGASSGGSVSQDDINTAIENYLTEHPVQSGATAEQAAQIQANTAAIGTEELPTTAKTLKGAIAETFQNVSNGKTLIASAITDKGVATSNTDTFQTMANNISLISGGETVANYQLKSEACLDYLKYLHEQRVSDYIETNGLFINGIAKTKEEISDWILNRDNFKYRGKLKKNGKFITDKNNCKFEIRGVGLHHILQYTNVHNKLNFETLKYYGINCIRVSVYLEDYRFASSDNQLSYGYISHPTESKAKIEELVDYCTELNLYNSNI